MSHEAWIEAALANPNLVENLYQEFDKNPNKVDSSWYFAFSGKERTPITVEDSTLRIYTLIQAYRINEHFAVQANSIEVRHKPEPWQLQLETLGFTADDLTREFPTCGLLSKETAPLQEIIDTLKSIYCGQIGIEYMGLGNPDMEKWIQERIEPSRFRISLTTDQKRMILQSLNRSELLETFIHMKYTGQKRFSLEGGETLIPMLEEVIETASQAGTSEFIIGMAHRGRLNVLSNILNKSHADIFSEFEEGYIPFSFEGSGDVKYHKGFFSEVSVSNGSKVRIVLSPNASHLESVDPIVEGQTRARQVSNNDTQQEKTIPILIHGDAAIAGQGVVYETMQLYQLPGYATGGTIHIVINNQVGFTAAPEEARSTCYCTDIAKTFSAPVFHVNAEDPEGCIFATILATELRQKFHCDVFIDLNCYRKYGHNEADEPAYTQPLEYQLIRQKRPIRELYRDDLIQQGVVEREIAEALEKEFTQALNLAMQEIKSSPKKAEPPAHPEKTAQDIFPEIPTGVSKKTLVEIAEKISQIPEGFTIHSKLEHLIQERLSMIKEESKPIDWGTAETLAYGSLLWEGVPIRLSGQDSRRGTFSHRHAAWVDQQNEQAYIPLQHLKDGQGRFDVLNSSLSEYAVLGFEYGYSVAALDTLVLWEAQFGDFSNGGQIIIDQYIATSEQKWGQKFRLTLLLPHGYEGQGPEHSSARMERFLSLAGQDNMRIVYPSTPAQFFHLLRKQMKNSIPKPLIVFTPKALLRHPACVSTLTDLSEGTFQEIIDDPEGNKKAKKLVFVSGKIYYELVAERAKRGVQDMALVRIEQLYPLQIDKILDILEKYKHVKEYIWAQEEPNNMGAWGFMLHFLEPLLPQGCKLRYVGRDRSASPAVGSYAIHKHQHAELLTHLFGQEKAVSKVKEKKERKRR